MYRKKLILTLIALSLAVVCGNSTARAETRASSNSTLYKINGVSQFNKLPLIRIYNGTLFAVKRVLIHRARGAGRLSYAKGYLESLHNALAMVEEFDCHAQDDENLNYSTYAWPTPLPTGYTFEDLDSITTIVSVQTGPVTCYNNPLNQVENRLIAELEAGSLPGAVLEQTAGECDRTDCDLIWLTDNKIYIGWWQ